MFVSQFIFSCYMSTANLVSNHLFPLILILYVSMYLFLYVSLPVFSFRLSISSLCLSVSILKLSLSTELSLLSLSFSISVFFFECLFLCLYFPIYVFGSFRLLSLISPQNFRLNEFNGTRLFSRITFPQKSFFLYNFITS